MCVWVTGASIGKYAIFGTHSIVVVDFPTTIMSSTCTSTDAATTHSHSDRNDMCRDLRRTCISAWIAGCASNCSSTRAASVALCGRWLLYLLYMWLSAASRTAARAVQLRVCVRAEIRKCIRVVCVCAKGSLDALMTSLPSEIHVSPTPHTHTHERIHMHQFRHDFLCSPHYIYTRFIYSL